MKAVVTIEEKQLTKIEFNHDGIQRVVYLPLEAFIETLNDSMFDESRVNETLAVVSPSLPAHTAKYARKGKDNDFLFVVHPKTKATITYHQDTFENIPIPSLVFCFGVRNHKIHTKTAYCYLDLFLRDDTPLYQIPLPNVFSDGKLCHYEEEPLHDLVELQTFAERWLAQAFNDHLYVPKKTNHHPGAFREFLVEVQSKESMDEWLIPAKKTFLQWSNQVLNITQ